MAIEVTLIDYTKDPIRALYMAYRVCYSALTPQQVIDRIDDERISHEKMEQFVQERLICARLRITVIHDEPLPCQHVGADGRVIGIIQPECLHRVTSGMRAGSSPICFMRTAAAKR